MPDALDVDLPDLRPGLLTVPRAILDLALAGLGSTDPAVLRTEILCHHRVAQRRFVANRLPKHGVGVELGVFTGLFSTQLLALAQPRVAYFVDVWWTAFGERFPNWGPYTDFGRLGTRAAHDAACRRIGKVGARSEAKVVVAEALSFIDGLPDAHLDWAYLDTGHTYDENRAIILALLPKLKPGAVLAGDDWCDDESHPHYGGARAVQDLIAEGELRLLEAPRRGQWIAEILGRPAD